MQLTTLLTGTLLAVLASAAPLEERAGPLSVNLYSDGNCATLLQTVTLLNRTCVAVPKGFNSAKVAANPNTNSVVDTYNQAGCSNGLTKAFFVNDVTTCHNAFQFGTAVSIQVEIAS